MTVRAEDAISALTESGLYLNWGTNRTSLRRKWLVNYMSPHKQTGKLVLLGRVIVEFYIGFKNKNI